MTVAGSLRIVVLRNLSTEQKLNLLKWVLLVADSDEGMYFSSLLRERIDLNTVSDELNTILLQSDTYPEFRRWFEIIESISKFKGSKCIFCCRRRQDFQNALEQDESRFQYE